MATPLPCLLEPGSDSWRFLSAAPGGACRCPQHLRRPGPAPGPAPPGVATPQVRAPRSGQGAHWPGPRPDDASPVTFPLDPALYGEMSGTVRGVAAPLAKRRGAERPDLTAADRRCPSCTRTERRGVAWRESKSLRSRLFPSCTLSKQGQVSDSDRKYGRPLKLPRKVEW